MNVPQTEVILRHSGKELAHVTLRSGEYVIGRHPDADIYADTPLISRRHALLTIKDDGLLIEDLGSINGIFVADQPITKAARLSPNQVIRLGDVSLEVRAAPPLTVPDPLPGPTAPTAPTAPTEPTAPTLPPDAPAAPATPAAAAEPTVRKDPPADVVAPASVPPATVAPPGLAQDLASFVKRHPVAAIGALAVLLLGGAWGAKGLVAGRRAQQVLAELRGTAPTFEAQSRALVNAGKFPEALEKITYAARLAPDDADYQLAHANLLQSSQQFSAAAEAYSRVLALRPNDAAAKTNLALSERLSGEKGNSASLPPGAQNLLLDALLTQHRDLEAAPLARLLGRGAQTAEATIRGRLTPFALQKNWQNTNIRPTGQGFSVNLSGLQIDDLGVLEGLPIVELFLNATSVTDLRPLAALPLEELALKGTPVTDLTPLRGLKLRRLDLSGTGVSDLSPLAGMPLENLALARTKVQDIAPLRGMPLTRLRLGGLAVTNVGPLADLADLEEVELPASATNFERLRSLKKLRYLSTRFDEASQHPAQTAAEFFKEEDAKKAPPPPKVTPPPARAAAPPGKPATPAEPVASPEDVAADAKALNEAKQKRLDLFGKFQFTEARTAILDPKLKTPAARDEQQLLAKKAQWLANFKASLVEELNKKGYGQPMSRKTGEGLSGTVAQADDQQITLRSPRGSVSVPWSDLSFDSIFTMGSSFILPDMQPDWVAYRKWHLGVFAFYAGKKPEALDLLHAAAKLKPLYKDELPVFEKPTNPW